MISVKTCRIVASAGSMGLLVASAATLAVLAHHPHFRAGSTEQLLHMAADAGLGAAAARVHGALIAILAVALYGVVELASALGMRRAPVAFGLAAYVLGGGAMSAAMLLDGFATAQIATILLQNLPAAARAPLDAAAPVFVLLSVLIQLFTKAGFCAMGIGMACLSLGAAGRSRRFGWAGALVALAPAGFAAFGGVWLRQPQLMALVACQTLWYLGAAVFLAVRVTGPSRRSRP